MALQIRRGTDAERTAGGGVVFAEGELVYVTDTDKLYIGDGATAGGIILAGQSLSTIGDYIVADTINTTLDLQQNLDLNGKDIIGTGNINIAGTVTATGDINLGDDANTDTVNLAAKITSSLTPNADSTHNIGAMNARWNNGYFTGLWVDGQINAVALNGDVIADDSTVMVDASTNTFTGDLTGDVTGDTTGTHTGAVVGDVTGNVTGNTTGSHTGDVKGSVFGDDSTPIIDAVNNTLAGNLTGDVTGNVTGDVVGDITGQVKGSSGTNVLSPNTGPADAELSVLNVTTTGTISGNVTGNVTGNLTGNAAGDHTGTFIGSVTATGTLDGDVTGSVFADDSTPLVDAINKAFTGNLTGDVTGAVTGNIFTNLIDSADSSAIIVTPVLQVDSDLIASNALIVGSGDQAGPGSENVILKNTGEILGASVVTGSIGGGAVDIEVEATSKFSFKESVTLEKSINVQDALTVQTIAGEFSGSLVVETFTGDPDDDASVADLANYDKHFDASTTKVSFGVPAQMAVVADDTARGTLVPSPAAGMMLFMTAGTSPSATNQLQVYNGTAWVNV